MKNIYFCFSGQHHHHLRAFATAFGQRTPFFDPRLVDPLREWEQFRRKTAEQWAMELPRRMGVAAGANPSGKKKKCSIISFMIS